MEQTGENGARASDPDNNAGDQLECTVWAESAENMVTVEIEGSRIGRKCTSR
jgi:hypothetical protein